MDKRIETTFTVYEDEIKKLIVEFLLDRENVEVQPSEITLLCDVDNMGHQYAFAASCKHTQDSIIHGQ